MGDPGRANANAAALLSDLPGAGSPSGSPRRRSATNPDDDLPGTDHLYFQKQIGMYRVLKKIGKGRYGLVKLGEHVANGNKVAIKIVNKARLNDVEKNAIRTEAEVMTILAHPNVIRLHEVLETSHEICMIMDYAAGGDLFDYVIKRKRLKEKEAHRIFLQIVSGVAYCHRHYIVHRDIKAENIFLDQDHNVRIGDWGFSSVFHPGSKIETHCGSLEYAAPEVLGGTAPLSASVDVWSLGVLLYFIVTGRLPFQGANDFDIYQMIKKANYKPPKHVTDLCRDLIKTLLTPDPTTRPTVEQILQHPWCKEEEPTVKSAVAAAKVGPLALFRRHSKDKLRSISDTKIETSILKVKAGTSEPTQSLDASSSESSPRGPPPRKKRHRSGNKTTPSPSSVSSPSSSKAKAKKRRSDEPRRSPRQGHAGRGFMVITEEDESAATETDDTLDELPPSFGSDTALTSTEEDVVRPEIKLPKHSSGSTLSSSAPGSSVDVRPVSPSRIIISRPDALVKRTKTPPRLVVANADEAAVKEEKTGSAVAGTSAAEERGLPRRRRSDKDMKGAARFSILNLDQQQLSELQKLKQFEVLQVTDKKTSSKASSSNRSGSDTMDSSLAPKAEKKVVVVSSKTPNSRSLLRAFESGKSLMRWNSDTGFRNSNSKHAAAVAAAVANLPSAASPVPSPAPVPSSSSSSSSKSKSSKDKDGSSSSMHASHSASNVPTSSHNTALLAPMGTAQLQANPPSASTAGAGASATEKERSTAKKKAAMIKTHSWSAKQFHEASSRPKNMKEHGRSSSSRSGRIHLSPDLAAIVEARPVEVHHSHEKEKDKEKSSSRPSSRSSSPSRKEKPSSRSSSPSRKEKPSSRSSSPSRKEKSSSRPSSRSSSPSRASSPKRNRSPTRSSSPGRSASPGRVSSASTTPTSSASTSPNVHVPKKMRRNKPSASVGDIPGLRPAPVVESQRT